MNTYTNFILTIIAVGILGLNYHLFKDEIFSTAAHAASGEVHKIALCNKTGKQCAKIGFYSNGLLIEQAHN